MGVWMLRFAQRCLVVGFFGGLLFARSAAAEESEGNEEGADPTSVDVASAAYTLGAGDSVSLRVYGEDRLSGVFLVHADGALDLPWVGRVEVVGLGPSEAADRVSQALRDGFLTEPQVAVEIKSYGSRPVQILGAVSRPGTYFLTGPTDLLGILAMAGGVRQDTKGGSLEIQVKRPKAGEQVLHTASLDQLLDEGTGNWSLQAGDLVHVTKGRVVFVSGQVARPGEIPWREGMTVTQALAAVGGHSPSARLRKAVLIRGNERIVLNIKAILDGDEPDRPLRADDQLLIDESKI